MAALPKITLDQWRTLISVVEAGGYAQVADRLHKSQSTLTYAVQKLERLLGVKVFEIHGRIELIESVLGGTDEALLEGRADLAIGSSVPPGFIGDPIMPVRFIATAHPDHPLHRLGRSLTLEDLRPHRHLVVRDTGRERSRTPGWLNERRWTVSHKATSIRTT